MATLLATGPAVVAGWAGRLGVFAVGRDGALYHRGQTHPSDGWSGWVRLGEPGVPLRAWPPVAGPVNLIDLFGLAVFATDVDQLLYRRVQQLPDGPWSAWEPVGGPFTGPPATIVGAGGVNYLFAVEYDQGTRTGVLVEQSDRSGGAWSPHPGADLAGSPFVAASADGRLEVLGLSGPRMKHQWQLAAGGWSSWFEHADPPGSIFEWNLALAPAADGRLELFAVSTAGELFHKAQTAPSNGWSGWSPFGGPGTRLMPLPALAANADGRLEVFAADAGGALHHRWQAAPNGGWSGWHALGNPGTRILGWNPTPVAANADGRLEVFAVTEDGVLHHRWQVAPTGGWSAWHSLGNP